MQVPLVMTVIARDRTGLVESVAALVAENGGNWLESRMCRLGGEFAGILRVSVPQDKRTVLVDALEALQAKGIQVVVRPDETGAPDTGSWTTVLELVGNDRPGIVRQITHVLAGQGVNVEELSTECVSAPMSGEMLFKARANLRIPGTCNAEALRAELEKIAGEMMVDIQLVDANQPA